MWVGSVIGWGATILACFSREVSSTDELTSYMGSTDKGNSLHFANGCPLKVFCTKCLQLTHWLGSKS